MARYAIDAPLLHVVAGDAPVSPGRQSVAPEPHPVTVDPVRERE